MSALDSFAYLSLADRNLLFMARGFLKNRLNESETVQWAIRLTPNDRIKKIALVELVNEQSNKIKEPWLTAYRVIEDFWNNGAHIEHYDLLLHEVINRINNGDRSRALVKDITTLVKPFINVEALSQLQNYYSPPPKRPTKVKHLYHFSIKSGAVIPTDTLNIHAITNADFLNSLAASLESCVLSGVDLEAYLNTKIFGEYWRSKVYRVSNEIGNDNYPDEFNTGIAPSVKLLHSVMSRLIETDRLMAQIYLNKWVSSDVEVLQRLWASLSLSSSVSLPNVVFDFLENTNDEQFWGDSEYPEIAELRSQRYSELALDQQKIIVARLRKMPPIRLFRRSATAQKIKEYRLYSALLELRRIEVSGGTLPPKDALWLRKYLPSYPDVEAELSGKLFERLQITTLEIDVPEEYNLGNDTLLSDLESDLSKDNDNSNEVYQARQWIRSHSNHLKILDELSVSHTPNYPYVISAVARAHCEGKDLPDFPEQALKFIDVLLKMPNEAFNAIKIDDITRWLLDAPVAVLENDKFGAIWMRLWPIAASRNERDFVEISKGEQRFHPYDNQTCRLTDMFVRLCPDLNECETPFELNSLLRNQRNLIERSDQKTKILAKFFLIKSLGYFYRADPEWTNAFLINAINQNESPLYWQALSQTRQWPPVLNLIASQMAIKVLDTNFRRETRTELLNNLIANSLVSRLKGHPPAIGDANLQQVIRSVEDEVRAKTVHNIKQFISWAIDNGESRKELFDITVHKFFTLVWPQERYLSSKNLSRNLASLPALAKDNFSIAVDIIERFLVPCSILSIYDYGFAYNTTSANSKLTLQDINNTDMAAGLLKLLDLTIGDEESDVIPTNLSEALDAIAAVSPKLKQKSSYRRLIFLARRV